MVYGAISFRDPRANLDYYVLYDCEAISPPREIRERYVRITRES